MDFIEYVPLLGRGFLVTIKAWACAGFASLAIGTFLGTLACRRLVSRRLLFAIRAYTFVAKGVPAYVQILIAYFVVPRLIGIEFSAFFAAIAALAFCSGGYVTEIVRSGINNIPRGQWDAATVLGYSTFSSLRRIILPQALMHVRQALVGEFEQLLKSTSLLATIGVSELMRSGMNIISRELNPVPVYLSIACIYLIASSFLFMINGYFDGGSHDLR